MYKNKILSARNYERRIEHLAQKLMRQSTLDFKRRKRLVFEFDLKILAIFWYNLNFMMYLFKPAKDSIAPKSFRYFQGS